jgi:hypothetical protein
MLYACCIKSYFNSELTGIGDNGKNGLREKKLQVVLRQEKPEPGAVKK